MSKTETEMSADLGGAIVRPTSEAQSEYEKQESARAAQVAERLQNAVQPAPGTKAFSVPDEPSQ